MFKTKTKRDEFVKNLKFLPSICEEDTKIYFKDNILYSFDRFFIIESRIKTQMNFKNGFIRDIADIEDCIIDSPDASEIERILNENIETNYSMEKELVSKLEKIDKAEDIVVKLKFEDKHIERILEEMSSFDDTYHKYPHFIINDKSIYLQYQIDKFEFDSTVVIKNEIKEQINLSLPYEVIGRLKKINTMQIDIKRNNELHGDVVCLFIDSDMIDTYVHYFILGEKDIF